MEPQLPTEKHPFPPFVPPDARYLLIGTFPGRALTQKEAKLNANDWYYGTHKHSLWKILEEVYGQELTTKQEKQNLLTALHIGITDVVEAARRRKPNNDDKNLDVVEFQAENLAALLQKNSFQALYFTSQQAQKWFVSLSKRLRDEYGLSHEQLAVAQHVLPSPSPLFLRFKHGTAADRLAEYRKLLPKLV